MATLGWRPRRTKANPYPHALPPKERWIDEHGNEIALRANDTWVRKRRGGTWVAITQATDANVRTFLAGHNYARKGGDA